MREPKVKPKRLCQFLVVGCNIDHEPLLLSYFRPQMMQSKAKQQNMTAAYLRFTFVQWEEVPTRLQSFYTVHGVIAATSAQCDVTCILSIQPHFHMTINGWSYSRNSLASKQLIFTHKFKQKCKVQWPAVLNSVHQRVMLTENSRCFYCVVGKRFNNILYIHNCFSGTM